MENGKKIYADVEIVIMKFPSSDIVTASTADNFTWVDENGWDA
jgi:hypothetical protein